MKKLLNNLGYDLDDEKNVWVKPNYAGISYNDGDEVEERLATIVENAIDLSVLSDELRRKCSDWPSIYHLSANRANLLRPFKNKFIGAEVLEIGAGCGAITRYLGECGANVIALEGTPRRASIARSRTRDLENVVVVADKFDQFHFDRKFDVVTLIGVLEYANLFMPANSEGSSALAMLARARSMLKPDGILIIAIENQLGLKYFAGAPEDHIGRAMYGLEGRYTDNEAKTFGKYTLDKLIKQAGFYQNQFFAPFPDYKLPVSIISEHGFSFEGFDAASLIAQSVKKDPQLPLDLVFSPELAFPNLINNGMGMEVANSFLIIAHNEGSKSFLNDEIAYHYSSNRASCFCKEAIFRQDCEGLITVHSNLLTNAATHKSRLLKHTINPKDEYIVGHLLHTELTDIVKHDGWNMDSIGAFLRRYLGIVVALLTTNDTVIEIGSIDSMLPGESFDLLPHNIMIRPNKEVVAIDREWISLQSLSVGFLIFRSLLLLLNSTTRFGASDNFSPKTWMGFFLASYKAVGFNVNEHQIYAYCELEKLFQLEVNQNEDLVYSIPFDKSIPSMNLHETLSDLRVKLGEQQDTVAKLEDKISALLNEIYKIQHSHSWIITKPFRSLVTKIRKCV